VVKLSLLLNRNVRYKVLNASIPRLAKQLAGHRFVYLQFRLYQRERNKQQVLVGNIPQPIYAICCK
jgi:hypothetical protein